MVDQLRELADARLLAGCIYCGGPEETKDHAPSRVFLDEPLPTNLPVVAACWRCNNGFSRDEEYLASLIESVVTGSTCPDQLERSKIAEILRRSPALQARLESARQVRNQQTYFDVESDRIKNVVRKLAMGHAAFELSAQCRGEPSELRWSPISLMGSEERQSYEECHHVETFGEIGSRGLQRLLVVQVTLRSASGELSTANMLINDWVEVQEGRYRYIANDDNLEVRVRFVIREYLACDVSWKKGGQFASDSPVSTVGTQNTNG